MQNHLFLHQSWETKGILSKSASGDRADNLPSIQLACESNISQLPKITGFCLLSYIIGLILEKCLSGYKLYHCYVETTCKFSAVGKGGKKINEL